MHLNGFGFHVNADINCVTGLTEFSTFVLHRAFYGATDQMMSGT